MCVVTGTYSRELRRVTRAIKMARCADRLTDQPVTTARRPASSLRPRVRIVETECETVGNTAIKVIFHTSSSRIREIFSRPVNRPKKEMDLPIAERSMSVRALECVMAE